MKIRCIAIDDEPLALDKLKKYIEDIPYLELVAACRGVHEAESVIEESEIDAMFVDINMPDTNGLDFVQRLEKRPLTVFITAYSEYAVESYKLHAVDYLLKPYDFEDFMRVAENLYEHWHLVSASENPASKDFVYLKTGTKLTRVAFDDVVYIEGMNEYLKIHPVSGDPYLTYATFKSLLTFLPDSFIQVHRSYVVNMKYALEIERSLLKMKGGDNIPIGGNYKDTLMHYVKKHLIQK